jgi:formylglycine-generating enzyme required for sulfatase activity
MSDPVRCPNGLCPIPAGTFKMGSTNGYLDEKPIRTVELSAYAMQKHEVTVGEYKAYLAEKAGGAFLAVINGCGAPASTEVVGKAKTRKEAAALLPKADGEKVCGTDTPPIESAVMPELPDGFGGDDQPMGNVNWQEARDYCQFYGMDLPTEAQWARGAMGLSGDKRYGTKSGQLSHEEAVYGTDTTAPVCSKPENDFGLCDMAGNAWEWTLDWYKGDAYETMAAKDPTGPSSGDSKVVRGGSWNDYDYYASHSLRAAYRNYDHPGYRNNDIGFRCVAAPRTPEAK